MFGMGCALFAAMWDMGIALTASSVGTAIFYFLMAAMMVVCAMWNLDGLLEEK